MSTETKEFIHNGRKIVISEGRGSLAMSSEAQPLTRSAVRISIDGEPVPVQLDPGTKRFIAVKHSPYVTHATLTDLAKHVADKVIGKRSS